MLSSVISADVMRHIAELRFCLDELRRRQTTDRLRAWLWRLKENAAQQALIMLLRLRGDQSSVVLEPAEQADLLAHHSLLQDPRRAKAAISKSHWHRDLQRRVTESARPVSGRWP